MTGTVVEWDDRLSDTNVIVAPRGLSGWPLNVLAKDAFLDHRLLVIDGHDWGNALGIIQAHGLDPRRRRFKGPFIEHKPPEDVRQAVDAILIGANALFLELFGWPAAIAHSSFRPMITGPEPLHYDSYGGEHPLVTAYVNVSAEPRVYRIGWNFEQLVDACPEGVRAAMAQRRLPTDDIAWSLRKRTERGEGPLGPKAPRHTVRLAPGAIWFFNAKTVSHEVVHGTGAVGMGWQVPTSGAELQHDILRRHRLS